MIHEEGRGWLSLYPRAIKEVIERRTRGRISRSFPTPTSSIVDFVARFSYSLHALPHFLSVTHSAVRRDASWPTRATTLNTTPTLTQPRVGEAGPRSLCMCLSVCAGVGYTCARGTPVRGPSARFHHHRRWIGSAHAPTAKNHPSQGESATESRRGACRVVSSYITCRAHRRQGVSLFFPLSFSPLFLSPREENSYSRRNFEGAKWGEATRGGSREERSLRLVNSETRRVVCTPEEDRGEEKGIEGLWTIVEHVCDDVEIVV